MTQSNSFALIESMRFPGGYNREPAPGEYRPTGPARSGRPFLASLGVHFLLILLLLGVRTASEALAPSVPRRSLVYSELAPAAHPPAVRPARAIQKLTLPAEAPVRSALALPHLAAPPARPVALPAAPPLPARAEPVKIALYEAPPAIAQPMRRPAPDVQLGSFSAPVIEKVALARVPAVTGAFAGSAKAAGKTAQVAVATGGFGEAATFRGERQGAATTAVAGFGDAAAGRANRTGGAGTTGPGGFGDAVVRTAAAEPRQVRAGDFQAAVAIETPKPAGKAVVAEGSESAIAILDKPRPSYTEEARQLKIEGEVSMEVLFAASGKAHVLRILRGLGHGLDESATRSAEAIRFRPAMRGGFPVDATAVARITFQLAY